MNPGPGHPDWDCCQKCAGTGCANCVCRNGRLKVSCPKCRTCQGLGSLRAVAERDAQRTAA